MDLKELGKLPLHERIAKLKELKEHFLNDKSKLNSIMKELEKAVAEREDFAKNTTVAGRKILKNEVRAITGSIKEAKLRVQAKEDELKLVEKALAEAEHMISRSERELEEETNVKKEKTLHDIMIDEQRKKEQEEEMQMQRSLEEQVKNEAIPEDVKKAAETSADYTKRQEENIYTSKTDGMFNEDLKPGYEKHKPEFKDDKEPWKENYEKEKEEYK
jgi:hypothetical protein